MRGWGGGIEKNHSSSKKLVLSLVAISFLSSYSYATTVSSAETSTKTISNSNNTVAIQNNGSIIIPTDNGNKNKQAILFQQGSSTSTFLNQGTLQGGSNAASVQLSSNNQNGVTIETFKNEGIIGNGSSKFAITVWGSSDNKSSITNFSNSGTISSKGGEAIYFGNTNIKTFSNERLIQGDRGINVADGTTIDNFSNSGTIHGINNRGINIGIIPRQNHDEPIAGVNIKTLTNSGTIKNDNTGNGIRVGYATIDNFSNSGLIQGNSIAGGLYTTNANIKTLTNSGTIINNGTLQPSSSASVSSGTFLIYSTIENFTNTGSTSGIMGVNLAQTTINNFTNQGTIESTSSNASAAGVNIMAIHGNPSTIDNLTNEGLIKSRAQGILVEIGNEIGTLTNKGTIDADLNGISFYDTGDFSGETVKLSKIILENGSSIKARRNGINLAGSSRSIEVDNIDVQKDATVSGDNAGIA
ncbi:TPA: hypothetical protein R1808_001557, partial [Campylobacter jejuni]|nr:hypothetical protein [Campylobacter jejuni]